MNAVAVAPVAVLGGVRLPAKAPKKVAATRVCKKVVAKVERKQQIKTVAAAAATPVLFAAAEANATELVTAQPQEVMDVALAAAAYYPVILGGFLAFTIGTYVVLTKVKLI
ncbi:hypothetical protein CYMTET_12195 [Cymbomonas tetramitiformis]|uniref:Uncharacterized protein n=1 Tax=Cymbomonas tetramitiformis TaxID=36881 RepID=A0AAE0LCE2_9CHLO|nr:hypothetical protein CYMTET_12195 [Cymbomonas tetramitiformis]